MMDEEALNASTTADSLLACLSAPDRALLSSFKNETNEPWTSYTVAKSVMTLRNQLCKQIYHDLPPEIAKKIAESSATASEHLSAKVYGEIEFAAYFNVLQQCSGCENTTIVDLGHGTGKALIAAFALYGDKLRKIHGIEIVPELLEESRRRIQMMETISLEQISSNIGSFQPFLRESLAGRSLPEVITVEYGDFLLENCEYDWTQADIVFANSTCFGFELMAKLSVKAERMRPGTTFVTFTLPLSSPEFEVIFKRNYGMSWGVGTAYIHRRK